MPEGLRYFQRQHDTGGGAGISPVADRRSSRGKGMVSADQPASGFPPETIDRSGGDRFHTFHTDLPGVRLVVEPYADIFLPRRTLDVLLEGARLFWSNRNRIKDLDARQRDIKKTIVGIVKRFPGLRGVQSAQEGDNFKLAIVPLVSYDRELLKQSLGARYSEVVRETRTLTLTVGESVETERGKIAGEIILGAAKGAIDSFQAKNPKGGDVVQVATKLDVDDRELDRLIASGRVTLLPGARTITTDDYRFDMDVLDKSSAAQKEKQSSS